MLKLGISNLWLPFVISTQMCFASLSSQPLFPPCYCCCAIAIAVMLRVGAGMRDKFLQCTCYMLIFIGQSRMIVYIMGESIRYDGAEMSMIPCTVK